MGMKSVTNFESFEDMFNYALSLLFETWDKATILDRGMFYSFVAMLVENRCLMDGEDVPSVFMGLAKAAKELRDKDGIEYKGMML